MSAGAWSGGSWNFELNREGRWSWSHKNVQGVDIEASDRLFRYLYEAIEDARRHGFRKDGSGASEAGEVRP